MYELLSYITVNNSGYFSDIYLSLRRTVDVQHKLHRHPMSSFLNAVVTANAAMTLDHLSVSGSLYSMFRRDFHLHTLILEGMN